jgi:tRNA-dihydrouridine synthase 3
LLLYSSNPPLTNTLLPNFNFIRIGLALSRKYLLEWLSFAHRYVPLGMVEGYTPGAPNTSASLIKMGLHGAYTRDIDGHRRNAVTELPVFCYGPAQPPPLCVGRSELETLLMSPAAEDWLRISELVLGPPPPNFKFEPKHKAAAYPSNIAATAEAIRISREQANEAHRS